jgi:UDP-N-acetyl-D-galactosamine dehydrogenase
MKLAIVGLGYVGLPLAIEFAKQHQVVGFDIDSTRIHDLRKGIDRTEEVGSSDIQARKSSLSLTNNVNDLRDISVYIITVPTPIDDSNCPDLSNLISATESIAPLLSPGDLVIYESTVYPGLTEEICLPLLEEKSNLTCIYKDDNESRGFYLGYSPERINPGDKTHNLRNVVKLVSGSSPRALDMVDSIYSTIVDVGTHRTTSIRVAEAAKVIENTQRDLNIALVNELALIFNRLGLDTKEVIEAAGTKWNFQRYMPGFVGGHCIGVDPYYLTHKAAAVGYRPEVILAGRRINDGMARIVAQILLKELVKRGLGWGKMKIAVLGLTFKENCPDQRNSKVPLFIDELKSWGAEVYCHDPYISEADCPSELDVRYLNLTRDRDFNAIAVCVPHEAYRALDPEKFKKMAATSSPVFLDIKSIYPRELLEAAGFGVIRL